MEKKLTKKVAQIKKVAVFLVGNYLQASCLLISDSREEHYQYAFYLYQTGKTEAIAKSKYTDLDTYQILLTEGGEYRVKVFIKKIGTAEVETKISSPVRKTWISDI